jgi:hypothetical protein
MRESQKSNLFDALSLTLTLSTADVAEASELFFFLSSNPIRRAKNKQRTE